MLILPELNFGTDNLIDYRGNLKEMWSKVTVGAYPDSEFYHLHRKASAIECDVVSYVKTRYEGTVRKTVSKLIIAGAACVYSQIVGANASKKRSLITRCNIFYGDVSIPERGVIVLDYETRGGGSVNVWYDVPSEVYGFVSQLAADWNIDVNILLRMLIVIGLSNYDKMKKSMALKPGSIKELPQEYVMLGNTELNKLIGYVKTYVSRVDTVLSSYLALNSEKIKSTNPELYNEIVEIVSSKDSVSD